MKKYKNLSSKQSSFKLVPSFIASDKANGKLENTKATQSQLDIIQSTPYYSGAIPGDFRYALLKFAAWHIFIARNIVDYYKNNHMYKTKRNLYENLCKDRIIRLAANIIHEFIFVDN